ncbi:hypothetical protein [Clostridium sp.]|uniref:hypothetical protein n=1 Tax=Clostridium sp. TaxID=1506 RepID=UPI001A596AB3|nr:hypothetical protein [Clostridium sp.]MBK5242116.1 hypothetical protein [Clostridium sp.]
MELNTLEREMLIDIYDADNLPGMSFEMEEYKLTEEDEKQKKQEFAFHLGKLKKSGFIKYKEDEAFSKSGLRNTKYNNNVTIIYEEKIHIDSKGEKLVELYNYNTAENQKEIFRCS